MRKIIRTVSVLLLCTMMCAPQLEARGRNNGGQGQRQTVSSTQRPGNSGQGNRPGGNNGNHGGNPGNPGSRPGNNGNHGGNPGNPGNRPGNNGNHGGNPGTRPGNNGNHGGNPGNNGNNGNRPGNNGNHGGNPGNRPGGNNHGHTPGRPTPPPNAHHGWNSLHWGRPDRPMMPPPRPWQRPTPPPSFRPGPHFPALRTVLGVAFGTAINLTINSLLYNGYNIAGYSSDAVYLNDVSQLNLMWPFATLYYSNGLLAASEFAYSTPYYDSARYNTAYGRLISAYGTPYATSPLGNGGVKATWWGPGGQFITLSYAPQRAADGSLRYFTTLSFGN